MTGGRDAIQIAFKLFLLELRYRSFDFDGKPSSLRMTGGRDAIRIAFEKIFHALCRAFKFSIKINQISK
ncbi:hypothetical protein [Peptoniphilus duerdenii]|uniref:hypothetical protein n=1 Tax=Peptoniphilus duerdenii TaxID=507750 RepID=UPI00254F7FCC|nr:hypothetical protein [Peptoniphilus duerdenii]